MYLWAAGYDLPPETTTLKPRDVGKTTTAVPRRGKRAARAKRERVKP